MSIPDAAVPPAASLFARTHLALWSGWERLRHRARFDEVESFCLFVGYPRSGHSLVGAMLNAHRHAVIAHELDACALVLAGHGRDGLFSRALARAAWFDLRGNTSNYRYDVPGQWQGRFERLRVLGDKLGGFAARAIDEHPDLVARLAATVRVPVRYVHVVRHPLDNVAAISLWHRMSLDDAIPYFFRLAGTVQRLGDAADTDLLTVRHEAMIDAPRRELARLCEFLGLEADASYLADCASVVAAAPNRTRGSVRWTASQLAEVERRASRLPFFAGYDFAPPRDERARRPAGVRAARGSLWSRIVLRWFPTERPPRELAGRDDAPAALHGGAGAQSRYWDQTARRAATRESLESWRAYMAGVYRRLLGDWLPAGGAGVRLKTDLFEEAVSRSRPLDDLGRDALGIDLSFAVALSARRRLAGVPGARCLVADLRALPLGDASVAGILSGSSLDHFARRADLEAGLRELARVLAPGGTLVLTLDNPHNPVVRLRNALPYRFLRAARLVPYYVGVTFGRADAERALAAAGLRVLETRGVAHAPRAPAIWLERLVERLGGRAPALSACCRLFEGLARWPSRYLTGYYLAFRVERADAGRAESVNATPAAVLPAAAPARKTA